MLEKLSEREHSIDHLKERGADKGGGQRFTFRVREQTMSSQTSTDSVPKANLRETAERRDGALMGLFERDDAILILKRKLSTFQKS